MNALPACLAVALLALAGCLAESPRPETPPPSEPEPSLVDDVLILPSCRQMSIELRQDRDTASQGLPPGYEPAGLGTAFLHLRVNDCDSLVVGNRSVAAPFRWATLSLQVRPNTGGNLSISEVVLRELIVPDAGLAQRLADFGFPARAGLVEASFDGAQWSAAIEAEGLAYQASGPTNPHVTAGASAWSTSAVGEDAGRWFWMVSDMHRTSSWRDLLPAVVTAQGGHLGTAQGGTWAGRADLSTLAMTLTFAERAAPR